MFYRIQLRDHIRVPPALFALGVEEAVIKSIKQKYEGMISAELGFVIDVVKISAVGEGVIIPGDGAGYYDTTFEIVSFKPELQEVVVGRIKDITDFGAFFSMGSMDAMVHISQTMDDYVSFAKDKVLTGRDSKKILKVGDVCKARIIAVSFKDLTNPKINVTMRQPGLGKLEWLEEEMQKEEKVSAK